MQMTRDFRLVLERHEKLCSDLTIEELGQARSGLREKLLGLAQGFTVINLTDEMRELAKLYVREGLVPSKYLPMPFTSPLRCSAVRTSWSVGISSIWSNAARGFW